MMKELSQEWFSQETLADIAGMLISCENTEMLVELSATFHPKVLQESANFSVSDANRAKTLLALAGMLMTCTNADDLSQVRAVFPADALKEAAQLCTATHRRQMKEWLLSSKKEIMQ